MGRINGFSLSAVSSIYSGVVSVNVSVLSEAERSIFINSISLVSGHDYTHRRQQIGVSKKSSIAGIAVMKSDIGSSSVV